MAAPEVPIRSGTTLKVRPVPGRLSRKAIESSPTLKFLASREPDEPEQWSSWWERRWLR